MRLDLGLVRPKFEAEPRIYELMSPGEATCTLARRDDFSWFRQISSAGVKLTDLLSL
ncbi:hypothetical protein A2U01_0101504, partial [Trifolium medium]|nr:hypothetical protein [Trifolium medium]